MGALNHKERWVFWISVAAMCVMAPLIGFRYEVQVSMVFAFLMIIAARPRKGAVWAVRYTIFFIGIVLARHSLCCWQPWVFLFDHGLYESSPAPFLIVSGAASLAVCFLFDQWPSRLKYCAVTLGVQALFYTALNVGVLDAVGGLLQTLVPVQTAYPAIWGFLQLQWMLVYYVTFYWLIRKEA